MSNPKSKIQNNVTLSEVEGPKSEVGVVIPTYNRAELLRAALDSVLAQTVLPKEIVVVDDGSNDHTEQVVAEASGKAARNGDKPHIIYLPGPHVNRRSEARNRGAAATTTPLIAFLDSDDLWKPQRIERQLEAWEQAPDADFAFCNVRRFDENGLVGDVGLPLNRDFNGYILGEILEEPRAVSSTLIVRREAFERVGKFREMRTNEDYELTLRLAAEYKASYVPETLVLMREHSERTSRVQKEIPLSDAIGIIKDFLAERSNLPTHIKARGHKTIANIHYKLARLALQSGDAPAARRHLRAMLRLRPWDRRALPTYVRSWFAR